MFHKHVYRHMASSNRADDDDDNELQKLKKNVLLIGLFPSCNEIT